jgi:hypothetical protein
VAALLAAMFVGVVPQLCAQTKAADHEEHIQRIEAKAVDVPLQANEPPLQLSLKKLMELYKIPALSIALIENYKIVWAKAYGVTDVGTIKSVTTKTLFQAGSLQQYTLLKKSGAQADVQETTLNTLGYTLLQEGNTRDAISVSTECPGISAIGQCVIAT